MHPMLLSVTVVCAATAGVAFALDDVKPAAPSAPDRKEPVRAEPTPAKPVVAVPWPHPLVTEVLFAVPTGEEGDANKDGVRDATGDEFVEIINPHERAIELRGYTIMDGSTNPKTRLQFTFPAMTLPPKGVVVLFNGSKSRITGPVGDPKVAPSGVNQNFKAAVFNMKLSSSRQGFSNTGDACVLKAPDGKLIQRVRWGKADEKTGGSSFLLDETAPSTSKSSVERDSIYKESMWSVHIDKANEAFSPGTFGIAPAPATEPKSTDAPSKP